MNLKTFHLLFVSCSSLLCFLFGGWLLRRHLVQGGGSLLFALLALAAGIGLIAYGFWFRRKITTREEDDARRRKTIHRIPAMLAVMLFADRAASACSVCYGDSEGPLIDGARGGVYLLFAMVLVMQIAFGSFFIVLWRRSRRNRQENPSTDTRSR